MWGRLTGLASTVQDTVEETLENLSMEQDVCKVNHFEFSFNFNEHVFMYTVVWVVRQLN